MEWGNLNEVTWCIEYLETAVGTEGLGAVVSRWLAQAYCLLDCIHCAASFIMDEENSPEAGIWSSPSNTCAAHRQGLHWQ